MLQLHWIKSTNDQWLNLSTVDLSDTTTQGVYIIWHVGNPGRVVYVGQGDIADRICDHRRNSAITQYAQQGVLKVTWASVAISLMDGVERYLADKWSPLVGDAHPNCSPIVVNSPW